MSATITIELRTVEQPIAYVDNTGHALCVTCQDERGTPADRCKPSDIGGEIGALFPTCDFCGCNLLTDSVERVTGTVVIEHVTCKIF